METCLPSIGTSKMSTNVNVAVGDVLKLRTMSDSFIEYYRCADRYSRFVLKGFPSESGYFRLGHDRLYGRSSGFKPSDSPTPPLHDATQHEVDGDGVIHLSFDIDETVDSMRQERYANHGSANEFFQSAIRDTYYLLRPLLPLHLRKHLQKLRLKGWNKIPFPTWPVDRTVDNVFEHLLRLALISSGEERIPFIWFWPEGASGCAIVTHDVETTLGRDFCSTVMDIDDSFAIKASFQVVPEKRYHVTRSYLDSITSRGFEVAVQDLNHDGNLYKNRSIFLERIKKINEYGRAWGATGFRSAILYRRQEWFGDLEFAYDMSVPNVAHLDPQHGGCCTVMPYFVGDILELPVTTIQDYSLFHILNDHSIDIWKQQAQLILEKHGLMNFIIHPDYVTHGREQEVFKALLAHLAKLRADNELWIPTAGEAAKWWRQRSRMTLVEDKQEWRIEGEGSAGARVAYASLKDNTIVYNVSM